MSLFKPAPKPPKKARKRKNSRAIKIYVTQERDGVCLYGLSTGKACSAGLDPHHIQPRGSGGEDIAENLITLCRAHHDDAQQNKIGRGTLRKKNLPYN